MSDCVAGQQADLIPETFLNSRESNVRFAEEENEIFVTVSTLGSRMPAQDTVSIIADAAPDLQVDRRMLIDGRLVTADKTFPSINPAPGEALGHAPDAGREMGVAGLEEFLERKTFAVPVLGAPA
jgi:hypothetical protein